MSTKKNILYVTHSPKKGGAEQSLIHLINHTDLTKYNVFLLCPFDTEYLDEITVPIKVYNLNLGSIKKSFGVGYLRKVLYIRNLVRKLKIDIIHANGWRAPWYIAPLKYMSKAKIIWHHRDVMHSKAYNIILPNFFDHIICISDYVKSSLKVKNESKCSVVYNGVDISNVVSAKKKRINDCTFNIGTFGRIVEWKRYDYMIEAIKIFSDMVGKKGWKFYIVGGTSIDGSEKYLDYLKNLVKSYGLEENIYFLGHQKNPIQIMSECHLTINFSECEPFGRVIIESLLAKTPVIVANSGGAPEIIRLTNGGLICEDGNINQLAQQIYEIYKLDEESYEQLSVTGYSNVKKYFDMKNLYKQVDKIYQQLLSLRA